MAVNQADMKCLVYNTVAPQGMQDHVKLRDELGHRISEEERNRLAYSDLTNERDSLQAKLERTLQALECDVPACGVCTVDLARNKKSKKRSGKVTGVDKFGRPLCRYHQPPAKEFIKNADLLKLLNNE